MRLILIDITKMELHKLQSLPLLKHSKLSRNTKASDLRKSSYLTHAVPDKPYIDDFFQYQRRRCYSEWLSNAPKIKEYEQLRINLIKN